jgi:hypothetical protein
LLEAASRVENVLKSPVPRVHFLDYAESSLVYELRAYIDDYSAAPAIDSELHKEIWYSFKRHGITIPFPQRDVNFRRATDAARQTRGRLVAVAGLPRGFVFELTEDRTTIGRSPTNLMCIGNIHVSSEHAVVERKDGGFVIRDLDSRLGTKVNGCPIESAPLNQGDIVEVGPVVLIYETDQAPPAEEPHRWLLKSTLPPPQSDDSETRLMTEEEGQQSAGNDPLL